MRLTVIFLLCCLTYVESSGGSSKLWAQEYQFFTPIAGTVSGTVGWDSFSPANPNNYVGPHGADVVEEGFSGSFLSVTPGGFKAGPNLYAFFSTPTWSIHAAGADTTLPFTSIALQIAVTPPGSGADLSANSFLLNGLAPDDYVFFGQRTSLGAGGGQPAQPVNYYWASWNGLNAASNLSFAVGPGGNHAVFASARVDYVNTSNPNYRIQGIPEPNTAVLLSLGFVALATGLRRRTHLA